MKKSIHPGFVGAISFDSGVAQDSFSEPGSSSLIGRMGEASAWLRAQLPLSTSITREKIAGKF